MILGVGVDLLAVGRMERELERDAAGFLGQVFSLDERDDCESMRQPARHYAARFAAKEAVFKALAMEPGGMTGWREVEIESPGEGPGRVVLSGALKQLAERRGVRRIWLSMTHTREMAAATVVFES